MKPNERLKKLREQMIEFHEMLKREVKEKEKKSAKKKKVSSKLNNYEFKNKKIYSDPKQKLSRPIKNETPNEDLIQRNKYNKKKNPYIFKKDSSSSNFSSDNDGIFYHTAKYPNPNPISESHKQNNKIISISSSDSSSTYSSSVTISSISSSFDSSDFSSSISDPILFHVDPKYTQPNTYHDSSNSSSSSNDYLKIRKLASNAAALSIAKDIRIQWTPKDDTTIQSPIHDESQSPILKPSKKAKCSSLSDGNEIAKNLFGETSSSDESQNEDEDVESIADELIEKLRLNVKELNLSDS